MNENIKAIQEMVETELADNKYSEYLMRLFKTTDHHQNNTNQGNQTGNQSGSADRSDEGILTYVAALIHLKHGFITIQFDFHNFHCPNR